MVNVILLLSLKYILWRSNRIRVPAIRQVRFLSSVGDSDECDNSSKANKGNLSALFEQADEELGLTNGKRIFQKPAISQPATPELSAPSSISPSSLKKVFFNIFELFSMNLTSSARFLGFEVWFNLSALLR